MRRRQRQESEALVRTEARLRDAADFIPLERMPEDLIDRALVGIGEGATPCRERAPHTWTPRLRTALLLLGVLTIGLRFAVLRHRTVSARPDRTSPTLAERSVSPPTEAPKNPIVTPPKVAKLSPILKKTAVVGKPNDKTASHPAQISERRYASRRPVVALKAIWREEIVRSDQQGMVVPVFTTHYDSDSDRTDITPGVAIVPVHSRVTTCALSASESDPTDSPVPYKER